MAFLENYPAKPRFLGSIELTDWTNFFYRSGYSLIFCKRKVSSLRKFQNLKSFPQLFKRETIKFRVKVQFLKLCILSRICMTNPKSIKYLSAAVAEPWKSFTKTYKFFGSPSFFQPFYYFYLCFFIILLDRKCCEAPHHLCVIRYFLSCNFFAIICIFCP